MPIGNPIRMRRYPWRTIHTICLPMQHNQTALERAFEIAASGSVNSVGDIRAQLKRERFDLHQLVGRALSGQLRRIIEKARADPELG